MDNSATFDKIAPILCENGYYIYCIDLPGHGKSSHRAKYDCYHFIDWIVISINIINHILQWKSFILMGHSMGGAVNSIIAGILSF